MAFGIMRLPVDATTTVVSNRKMIGTHREHSVLHSSGFIFMDLFYKVKVKKSKSKRQSRLNSKPSEKNTTALESTLKRHNTNLLGRDINNTVCNKHCFHMRHGRPNSVKSKSKFMENNCSFLEYFSVF